MISYEVTCRLDTSASITLRRVCAHVQTIISFLERSPFSGASYATISFLTNKTISTVEASRNARVYKQKWTQYHKQTGDQHLACKLILVVKRNGSPALAHQTSNTWGARTTCFSHFKNPLQMTLSCSTAPLTGYHLDGNAIPSPLGLSVAPKFVRALSYFFPNC